MNSLSPNLEKAVAGQYTLPIKEIFREAWQKVSGAKLSFWGAFGWIALITLGAIVVQALVTTATTVFNLPKIGQAFNIIDNFVMSILLTVLGISIVYLMVRHVAGQAIRAKQIFALNGMTKRLITMGFISYLAKIVFLFASFFTVIYLHIDQNTSAFFSILIAAVFALVILITIQITLAWRMALLLVIEKQLHVWLAIKIALKAITKQLSKNVWLFLLAVIFLVTTSIVTLGIAMIWTFPMMVNLNAIWYRQIFGFEAVTQN